MCESHALTEPCSASCGRRRRIWEVAGGYQCSILGTCLSMQRTRKLVDKYGTDKVSRMSDYEVHCAAVDLARKPGVGAKAFDKALQKAHAAALGRYETAQSKDALEALWREDVAEGQISGPYFALMTHPLLEPELLCEAFGVVHMLSHLMGTGNRNKLEQAESALERSRALEQELRDEKKARREERKTWKAKQTELERALAEAERRIAQNERALAAHDPARLEEHAEAREAAERALAKSERRLEHALSALEAARRETEDARSEAARARRDAERPTETVPQPAAEPAPVAAGDSSCPLESDPLPCLANEPVVLYVGGERGMLPHLRKLARQARCRLIHHDGGREDRLGGLPRLCSKADAILCPVDRVGHVAVDHVKRACANDAKTFVPLRRASVDAFEKGLRELAALAAARASVA